MSTLTTKQEWIQVTTDNWKDLTAIAERFMGTETILVANHHKENESYNQLWSLFNLIWLSAPDQAWIHRIPGWGVLCDLCSEGPECLGV